MLAESTEFNTGRRPRDDNGQHERKTENWFDQMKKKKMCAEQI